VVDIVFSSTANRIREFFELRNWQFCLYALLKRFVRAIFVRFCLMGGSQWSVPMFPMTQSKRIGQLR